MLPTLYYVVHLTINALHCSKKKQTLIYYYQQTTNVRLVITPYKNLILVQPSQLLQLRGRETRATMERTTLIITQQRQTLHLSHKLQSKIHGRIYSYTRLMAVRDGGAAGPKPFSWSASLPSGTCPSLRLDHWQKLADCHALPSLAHAQHHRALDHAQQHYARRIHLCPEAILGHHHHPSHVHCKFPVPLDVSLAQNLPKELVQHD